MVEVAPFVMVVLIVAIVSYARTQRARYEALGRAPAPPEDDARLQGELRSLRDRVAVLERIVTDGDGARAVALEREIERLRDHEGARP